MPIPDRYKGDLLFYGDRHVPIPNSTNADFIRAEQSKYINRTYNSFNNEQGFFGKKMLSYYRNELLGEMDRLTLLIIIDFRSTL